MPWTTVETAVPDQTTLCHAAGISSFLLLALRSGREKNCLPGCTYMLARLCEIGWKRCILFTYCRQEDATFFSQYSNNLLRFFVQTSWVGGLSRVWKNALSITPNRVSISFITKGAEPADSLNITVPLSEQPILRQGRRALCGQGKSAEFFHKLTNTGSPKVTVLVWTAVIFLICHFIKESF